MFSRTARYYDLIYSFKDYASEVGKIRDVIRTEHPAARSILDVACGTAEHAKLLTPEFSPWMELTCSLEFIEVALCKVPTGNFSIADMRSFQLGKKYDVVQCLFSSIGYLTRGDEVVQALECFAKHLAEGGVILVEPWFTPDFWRVGTLHMQPVDTPELKICRISVSERRGNLSLIPFHYLIATADGVEYVREDHELALYTADEMLGFFERAGLKVKHDEEGISGRGLYIARL